MLLGCKAKFQTDPFFFTKCTDAKSSYPQNLSFWNFIEEVRLAVPKSIYRVVWTLAATKRVLRLVYSRYIHGTYFQHFP